SLEKPITNHQELRGATRRHRPLFPIGFKHGPANRAGAEKRASERKFIGAGIRFPAQEALRTCKLDFRFALQGGLALKAFIISRAAVGTLTDLSGD
ncbi:MAG: hypothetical protein AB7E95_10275, partial [Kiritimatiellales bacterium]